MVFRNGNVCADGLAWSGDDGGDTEGDEMIRAGSLRPLCVIETVVSAYCRLDIMFVAVGGCCNRWIVVVVA